MDAEAANAARTRGRRGTYENWYVTVNDPARRQGYWLRYTSFNPAPGVDVEPHCALWGFFFDHEDPSANWGAKCTFPLGTLQLQSRPFVLRIEDAMLSRKGCSGEVESERGRMRWDLHWDSRERPFPFLSPPWHMLSAVANIGVQPAIKVFGTIDVNGKTAHLEHAPGGQQHTWAHINRWSGTLDSPQATISGSTALRRASDPRSAANSLAPRWACTRANTDLYSTGPCAS